MMRRKRRNHAPGFKAKVALAALSGEVARAELALDRVLGWSFYVVPEGHPKDATSFVETDSGILCWGLSM